MAECGGGFSADRHHMTVANRILRGGPWRPISVRTDRKRRKSAQQRALRARTRTVHGAAAWAAAANTRRL